MIWINVFILLILILAPVMAAIMGADGMLIALLCLPVGGWFWIGIWGYLRQRQ